MRVRNTGDRAGREVVQVYASRPDSAVARPPRWLAGWAVVEAGPGEEVTAEVAIAPRAYEHWSVADGGWRTESGTFVLSAGRSSADLPLRLDVSRSNGRAARPTRAAAGLPARPGRAP